MTQPVNFKLAKFLKQKGFNKPTIMAYEYRFAEHESSNYKGMLTNKILQCDILAPTISEVVEWLYEKYDLWLWVEQKHTTNKFEWICKYKHKGLYKDFEISLYDTHTEAFEKGIKYVIIHIIE